MAGFVYLFNAQGTSFFKIGMTVNLRSRIAGIQTSSPLKIRYVHAAFVEDPRKIEAELHNQFADCRHFLEWFNFDAECVKECCLLMSLAHDEILYQRSLDPDKNPVNQESQLGLQAKELERLLAMTPEVPAPELSLAVQEHVTDRNPKALDDLPHELRAIAAYAQKQGGWITARESAQNIRLLKGQSTEQIRAMFQGLHDHGVGSLQGDGDRLSYCFSSDIEIPAFLPHELKAIAEFAKRKGETVKARDVMGGIRHFRDGGFSSAQIRGYFAQLAQLGVGAVEGEGDFLGYRFP